MIRNSYAYKKKTRSDALFLPGREPKQAECLFCQAVCPLVEDGAGEWTYDGWQWLHHHGNGHQSVVYVPKEAL